MMNTAFHILLEATVRNQLRRGMRPTMWASERKTYMYSLLNVNYTLHPDAGLEHDNKQTERAKEAANE